MDKNKEELKKLSEVRQTTGAEIKLSIDSLLYIALFNKGSQTEAARFIYGKDAIRVNQGPIIRAKTRMMESEYIEGTDATKIRRQSYVSTPKPVITYVKNELSEKYKEQSKSKSKSKYHLSDKEEKILFKIIDSEWFRSFLSKDKINAGKCPFIYRAKSGSLIISKSAMEIVASLLNDISTLNLAFSRANLSDRRPDNVVFDINTSFDDFARNWISKNFESERNFIERVIKSGSEYYKKDVANMFLDYTSSLFFLAIPSSLAFKLVHIGRIQTTILTGINNGMVSLLEKDSKKWHSYFKEWALSDWDVTDTDLSVMLSHI